MTPPASHDRPFSPRQRAQGTVQALSPSAAAAAALAMDTIDMTFDPAPTRQAFPDLPNTDMPTALKELLT
jgi:hypothetical protein